MRNTLRRIANGLSFGMDKYLPDALVLAIVLTVITFVMGIGIAGSTPLEMIQYWGNGFWGFLAFGMEMTLALATGFVVATAPPGKAALRRLARIPKSSPAAVVFVLILIGIIGWLNWGVGLVMGAFLCREIANNLKKVDFRLLVAAAYTASAGFAVLGPSGPEFLLIATPGNFLEEPLGGLYPYSTTIFDPCTLTAVVLTLFIVLPLLSWAVHPDEKDTPLVDPAIKKRFADEDNMALEIKKNAKPKNEMTPAEKWDNSPVWNIIVAVGGTVYIVWYFATKGFNISIDFMNFIILIIGVILHKTPRSLLAAFEEGVKGSYAIVMQFPFYAGIQGMMASSGLIGIIATFFAGISTPDTFVHWNYVCNAILNIFVPSSGGLFMVAGPAMATAGTLLGVPGNQTIIAFTAGEAVSNIIQPFWAIPLLGIAGLKMKDVMGYCILFFIVATIIFNVCFAVMW